MDIEITDIFLQDKIMQNESDNYREKQVRCIYAPHL